LGRNLSEYLQRQGNGLCETARTRTNKELNRSLPKTESKGNEPPSSTTVLMPPMPPLKKHGNKAFFSKDVAEALKGSG